MKNFIFILLFIISQKSFSYVFGEDGRERINLRDTQLSAIGQYGDHCSAVAISKRYVLTAAHCVYGRDLQFLIGEFRAARNGFKRSALARVNPAKIYFPSNFINMRMTISFDRQYDFALIFLEEDLPEEIVPLKLEIPSILPQDAMSVIGYPEDKMLLLRVFAYKSTCDIFVIDRRYMYHYCDMLPGQSGGATLWEENGKQKLIGINISQNSVSQGGTQVPTHNMSLMIDQEMISMIKRWMLGDKSQSEFWCKRGYCL